MSARAPEPVEFDALTSGGTGLAGDEAGEGAAIVAVHGLTATRRYVVHGSQVLPRRGYRLITYDARGHGASAPAPAGESYAYPYLADDLARVVLARVGDGRRAVFAGHSMGAHTLAAYALADAERIAGLVVIGPAVTGEPPAPEELERWDRLAAGLERGGTEGFLAAFDEGLDPRWRETVLRFTRERISLHEHPEAVAAALRDVPRSVPFDRLTELGAIDAPALVVASHDEADPGHPRAVAEAWAEAMPRAELVSEEPGESPLAWQGGRLSRAIAAFCERDDVAERLAAPPA